MKKFILSIIFVVLLISCSQDPAEIEYDKNRYESTYSETYVESPDGKMARNLRGNRNKVRTDDNEISIINEDYVKSVKTINYKDYKVLKGDNLNSISKKFKSNVDELARINNLKKPYNIYVGQIIKIPDNGLANVQAATKPVTTYYVVKSGDNLTAIAKKHNVSLEEIAKLNDLKKPYNLKVGQKLKIKTENVVISTAESFYTVKSGDNLTSIAKKNNTTTEKLAELNNLKKPYTLKIGQKLKLNASPMSKPSVYMVKSGDNLGVIAQKNKTTVAKLAELNNLKKPYNVYVGQKLKLNNGGGVLEIKETAPAVAKTIPTTTPTTITANTTKTTAPKGGFSWPLRGEIISSFGSKPNGSYNDGINIAGRFGDKILATGDGVVSYVGNEIRAYGTIILIKHSDNWISVYGHCDAVNVARGDKVRKGETIATVGRSGSVNTPQLYFALRKGEKMVDPVKYLQN